MSEPLAGLEPRRLWALFSRLAAIPRPSGHERQVADWVRSIAAENGWKSRADAVGNLILGVPATPGHESAATVVIQGHLDMVCEKNKDVVFDFMKDPIRLRIDGDWVRGTGTTLGADNGVGVAAALAAATDPAVVHGPLELLLTVDEETGLTGAQGLDGALISGGTLLNLDSEEDGKLFVGCAGGGGCQIDLDATMVPAPHSAAGLALSVTGLRGGHSGLEIHENRGNALKLLVRLLQAARDGGLEFELADLQGGSQHNAIPREAQATLALEAPAASRMQGVVACMVEGFRDELWGIDEGLRLSCVTADRPAAVASRGDRDRLLDLLSVLPHGVLGMSPAIPGLVETSNNLALVQRTAGTFRVVTSARSSVASTRQAVVASTLAAARLAGARAEARAGYPGWKPNLDSPVLAVARTVFAEQWGRAPEVTAVHAGLECGLVGEKVPGLDMISFGPQIMGAHSPDERVQISSVQRFYRALTAILRRLA